MTSYEFYVCKYGGKAIQPDEWQTAYADADALIRRYERLYRVEYPADSARDTAVCAIADAQRRFADVQSGAAAAPASVTIGSVSESYAANTAAAIDATPKAQAAEYYRILCLYADVYRGVQLMRYEGALRSPIYDLCRQTVTVYHACYNPFRVTRCVIHGAYFERKTVQTVDKSGGKSCDEFLLVIPNKNARRAAPALFNGIPGVYVLECGDRIVEGVGEEITTREQWGSFVPANRPGVVTVDWVRDMGCRNVLYHVEAGGKQ